LHCSSDVKIFFALLVTSVLTCALAPQVSANGKAAAKPSRADARAVARIVAPVKPASVARDLRRYRADGQALLKTGGALAAGEGYFKGPTPRGEVTFEEALNGERGASRARGQRTLSAHSGAKGFAATRSRGRETGRRYRVRGEHVTRQDRAEMTVGASKIRLTVERYLTPGGQATAAARLEVEVVAASGRSVLIAAHEGDASASVEGSFFGVAHELAADRVALSAALAATLPAHAEALAKFLAAP